MRWVLLFLCFTLPLSAMHLRQPIDESFINFKNNQIVVCPASIIHSPPTFKERNCRSVSGGEINPHRKAIWVRGTIDPPKDLLESRHPIALFLSVKASSRVYLNGILIGQNGLPGKSKTAETSGNLDSVFFIPRNQLKKQDNEIILLLSAQHSHIRSSQSLLTLEFGPYLKPPHHGRNSYWVSLMTFGIFLVGGVYFGVAAKLKYKTIVSATLSFASFLAAMQLITEISRGFWAYPYPFHDIRLFLLCIFSLGVGFSLTFHTYDKFNLQHRYKFLIGLLAATLLGLFVIPSFDGKVSWLILAPSLAACAGATLVIYRKEQKAASYAAAFFCFAALILANPKQFLDSYYYFALMALFISIFVHQAHSFQSAIRDYENAENDRSQLETALEKLTSAPAIFLLVKSAGKQERVSTSDIIALSGAGDYTSIRLIGGRELLHRESLATLYKELPSSFLRVHRSHIINTTYIRELKRLPSGVGELRLVGDYIVPVSRRVMPRIRKTLLGKTS